MSILVLTTGGTIGAEPYPDPKHSPKNATMPETGHDLVREALDKQFSNMPSRCVSLEPRDSKFIDQTYRDNIISLIEKASENAALITHGTDTLLQSAEYFYEAQKNRAALKSKTILVTGSMVPLANGAESDGYMNLKFSLEKLHKGALNAGVYVVLCDFTDAAKRSGWVPQLYPFAPARYEKFYDEQDSRYCRLQVKAAN